MCYTVLYPYWFLSSSPFPVLLHISVMHNDHHHKSINEAWIWIPTDSMETLSTMASGHLKLSKETRRRHSIGTAHSSKLYKQSSQLTTLENFESKRFCCKNSMGRDVIRVTRNWHFWKLCGYFSGNFGQYDQKWTF